MLELREQKERIKAELNNIDEALNAKELELFNELDKNNSTGFNYKGKYFCQVNRTSYKAIPEKVEELYRYMKESGLEDMFTVNAKRLSGWARERCEEFKENLTDAEKVNFKITPELADYIDLYTEPGIQIRKQNK